MNPNEEILRKRIEADIQNQAQMLPALLREDPVRGLRVVSAWSEASQDLLALFGLVEDAPGRRGRNHKKASIGLEDSGGAIVFGSSEGFAEPSLPPAALTAMDQVSTVLGPLLDPSNQAASARQIHALTDALESARRMKDSALEAALLQKLQPLLGLPAPAAEDDPPARRVDISPVVPPTTLGGPVPMLSSEPGAPPPDPREGTGPLDPMRGSPAQIVGLDLELALAEGVVHG